MGWHVMKGQVSASTILLLAISYLRCQHARREPADDGTVGQTLVEIVVGELAHHIIVDFANRFTQMFEMVF
jgi:hypothetical protein